MSSNFELEIPIIRRDRSASVAWVEFLTAPSDEESYSEEEDDSKASNIERKQKSGRIDNAIFDKFSDGSDHILIGKLIAMLESNGLQRSDYRLNDLFATLRKILKKREAVHRGHMNDNFVGSIETLHLTREEFKEIIIPNIFIISTAFRNHFIIPKFDIFSQIIEDIYQSCMELEGGEMASTLKKYVASNWGVSVCTIDGQRFSVGDTGRPVTMHALSKPLMYAYALQEIGKQEVHKYVGQEPSGHMFNELVLDHKKRPHNPMINAGSIMMHALLQKLYLPKLTSAQRFDATHKLFTQLSGGEYIGFSNGMFLHQRNASDRNWALGHFMKENECFPPGVDLSNCLEYYLQSTSMEATIEVLSVIAATFANGGICPVTGERILAEDVVADVLSVMFSCGMLEFSGKFGFRVGLPAKSAVSGVIFLVVPNVCGIAMWSPPLDANRNSVRGVAFCEKLVETFNFHCCDVDKTSKIDPTRKTLETKGSNSIVLKFSAAAGDLDSIFRLHLCGVDMGMFDCDQRTALHVASCEGHYEICNYLLKQCGVQHDMVDRWGNTPYDEAVQFGHEDCAELLKNWNPNKRRYSSSKTSRLSSSFLNE